MTWLQQIYCVLTFKLLHELLQRSRCGLNQKQTHNMVTVVYAISSTVLSGVAFFYPQIIPHLIIFCRGYNLWDMTNYFENGWVKKSRGVMIFHHVATLYSLSYLYWIGNENPAKSLDGYMTLLGLFGAELMNIPCLLAYHRLHSDNPGDMSLIYKAEVFGYLVGRNIVGMIGLYYTTDKVLKLSCLILWSLSIYWGVIVEKIRRKYERQKGYQGTLLSDIQKID